MDSAHDITECFAGSTDRGELWLELVEVSTEDERVSHQLAVPVVAGQLLDWSAARWADCGEATHAPVSTFQLRLIRELQAAGRVPGDAALLDAWETSGGPEAKRAWAMDMAI